MSNEEKIDLSAPHLVGMYFETSDDGTEFIFPPVEQHIVATEDIDKNSEQTLCENSGCGGKVKVTEEGNSKYAWYYLTNTGNKYAGVTIERKWVYQGRWKKQTVRHRLYPGQHKEVFSFPRNQKPACCVTACGFE